MTEKCSWLLCWIGAHEWGTKTTSRNVEVFEGDAGHRPIVILKVVEGWCKHCGRPLLSKRRMT